MLLKSCTSLTCFRACSLLGRAKDLSAPRYIYIGAGRRATWPLAVRRVCSVRNCLSVCLSVYRRPVLDTGQCTENMITVNDCHLSFLCIMHLAWNVELHNYSAPSDKCRTTQLHGPLSTATPCPPGSLQLNAATQGVQEVRPPLKLSSKRSAQKNEKRRLWQRDSVGRDRLRSAEQDDKLAEPGRSDLTTWIISKRWAQLRATATQCVLLLSAFGNATSRNVVRTDSLRHSNVCQHCLSAVRTDSLRHSDVCQHCLSAVPTVAHQIYQTIFLPEVSPLPFISALLNSGLASVWTLQCHTLAYTRSVYILICGTIMSL